MSPLTINFNQFIDLTINPHYGTINTTLLHTLLHLIIDQLKLSSCLVEFHGSGCELIENQILCNKNYQCGLKVKQYEIKQEIDEDDVNEESSNGNECGKLKKSDRNEILDEMPTMKKLFKIADVLEEDNGLHPIGYPLSPIRPISTEDFRMFEMKVNSIHDVVANVMPTDSAIINETDETNSVMKGLIDHVNATKRIDALEIGLRQLVNIMKKRQCENLQMNEMRKEIEEKIMKIENYEATRDTKEDVSDDDDGDKFAEALDILEKRLNKLTDVIDNIHCKCTESDYEDLLFQRFYDIIVTEFKAQQTALHDEIENVKNVNHDRYMELSSEVTECKKSIIESHEKLKNDLITSLKEIQDIFDTKLNKSDIIELKNFLRTTLKSFEEKIENVECNRALAAGITAKIFKDITCLSCGDKVIQIDDPMTTSTQMLTKILTKRTTDVDNQQLNLYQLDTRLCGGNHTITVPGERIFRSTGGEKMKEKKFEK